MISVGSDSVWEPVVSKSTQRCYDDFNGVSKDLYCNAPMNFLYDIVNCVYKENFLRYPNYNPSGLTGCEAARQYIDECM